MSRSLNDLLSQPVLVNTLTKVGGSTERVEDLTGGRAARVLGVHYTTAVATGTCALFNALTATTFNDAVFLVTAQGDMTRSARFYPMGLLFDVGISYSTTGPVNCHIQLFYQLEE